MINGNTKFSELLDNSDALQHDNPNHDPKTGKFTTADAIGVVSATKSATNTVDKTIGSVSSIKGKPVYPSHYDNMSDQDLQNRINRLSKEHQFSDLVGDTKYVKSGSDKAREILQSIGAVLGVATSGLVIYKLAKKKP